MFWLGLSLEGLEERFVGFSSGPPLKQRQRSVFSRGDLLRVYAFAPFCLHQLLKRPLNTRTRCLRVRRAVAQPLRCIYLQLNELN